MINNIVSLSAKFIRIKSVQGNTKALEEVLGLALSELKGFKIERFEKNGSKSALIYNSTKRPKKFKIILNGHLDVVPGKEHQYSPKIVNNKLYGVGALDMKSNVACLLNVFKEMAAKVNYPLGLQLVTDEETGGFNGTKHQIEEGVRADFVIAGETTNFQIAHKAKEILWLKISAKGKTAHGAYPWRGENSIWKMNKFLNLLEKKYPLPTKEKWGTTINLSRIETGNRSFNKIPDACEVWLDIRYVPEEAAIIKKDLKTLLPKGFKLEVVVDEPAMFVDEHNHYLKTLQKIAAEVTGKKVTCYGAQGSSDARHFTRVNCNGIEFGPLGGGIGTDAEWIDITSLGKYTSILTKFLASI